MPPTSTAVAHLTPQQNTTLKSLKKTMLTGEQLQALQTAIPRGLAISPEVIYNGVVESFMQNPALFQCNPLSVILCARAAAGLGLIIGPTLGHAYLVPFKDVCTFMPSYRGIIQLVLRSGMVARISADCVHEGDHFRCLRGSDARIDHEHGLKRTAVITHAYAVARLKGADDSDFECMSVDDLIAHGQRHSKFFHSDKSIWKSDPPAAYMKTVLKKLCKRLPMSTGLQQVIASSENPWVVDENARLMLGDLATSPAEMIANQVESKLEEQRGGDPSTDEPADLP